MEFGDKEGMRMFSSSVQKLKLIIHFWGSQMYLGRLHWWPDAS